MEKLKRQSRYKRPKAEDIARLMLQPKDLEIVRLVYDYRFIRTDQITALIAGDRTSLEKRLRKLWEHRFLERFFLPVVNGKEPTTRRAIYSLDYQGANQLIKNDGVDPDHIKHVLRHNQPEYSYVEHQLMTSQFRAVLTLALKASKEANIAFWRQDTDLRDHVEISDKKGRKERLPIAPDGYFCLEDEDKKRMYWFLEVDRYTMSGPRWLEKMRAYYNYWFQKKHTDKFGIKSFRVISVCPNAFQRNARLELTKKVNVNRVGNKVEIIGSRLFWFVSEEEYSLKNPKNILGPILKVAKQGSESGHKILE